MTKACGEEKQRGCQDAGVDEGHMQKRKQKPRQRIYVCHTMYHVYVSLLKEMAIARETAERRAPQEENGAGKGKDTAGKADIALSRVFMDFGDLGERIGAEGIFDRVLALDERRDADFPELMKYKKNHHNIVRHMINRMIYTKKYGKIQESYIDIDFTQYEDIYVYCDSDPIGYYLSYRHIYYHALEDGLDCLQNFDAAHVDNAGHFKLKAYLAAKNLIFIQNGYGKYCLDFEMNDCSVVPYRFEKYKELPRKPLERSLTGAQKKTMLRIFLPDADEIVARLAGCSDCVLFLTEAFPPEEDVRIAVCGQVLREHCAGRRVVIKPHPRDAIDYAAYYPQCVMIRGKFPIEVLNLIEGIHFAKAVSIITSALDAITFADEKYNIGPQIWDAYEPKERHAFMMEGFMRRKREREAQEQKQKQDTNQKQSSCG
ncbi:MAG: glycosyltransferase family 52 protein [bacterium]|nr:glycosyltransferase family 52 protein [bacterium]